MEMEQGVALMLIMLYVWVLIKSSNEDEGVDING